VQYTNRVALPSRVHGGMHPALRGYSPASLFTKQSDNQQQTVNFDSVQTQPEFNIFTC